MRRHWISARPSTSARHALHLMRVARLRQLPVVEEGILRGVVSYRALAEAVVTGLAERVDDVTSSESETGVASMSLVEAAARIARSPSGCLPVVDQGPAGPRLVGLLTESDLLRLAYGSVAGRRPV